MMDIERDLLQADAANAKAQQDKKRADAEAVVRDIKAQTPLSNYGYSEEQFDFVGYVADGGFLKVGEAGVELPNKYIKPRQMFVAGRDIASNEKVISPYKDKGKFIDRAATELHMSRKATGAQPPPTDIKALTSAAFGIANEGVDYAGFSVQFPDWPEDQKRKAWQASSQAIQTLQVEKEIIEATRGQHSKIREAQGSWLQNASVTAPEEQPRQPVQKIELPQFGEKLTPQGLRDNPKWAAFSKEFYKELSGNEWTGDDKAAANFGLWWMSMFNFNTSYMATMAVRASNTKSDKLKQMMYAMLTVDNNLEMSAEGAGRALWAIGADPANWAGGAVIAKVAGKQVAKDKMLAELSKWGVVKAAAKGGAKAGAAEGAAFAGLEDFLAQTVTIEAGAQEAYSPAQGAAATATGAGVGAALGGALGAAVSDPVVDFGKQLANDAMRRAMEAKPMMAGSMRSQIGSVGDVGNMPVPFSQAAPDAPVPRVVPYLYNELPLALDDLIQTNKPIPAQKLIGMIDSWAQSRPEVKPEEVGWTGVHDWLDSKGSESVTKAELLDWLDKEGSIKVLPKWYGGKKVKWRQAQSETLDAPDPKMEKALVAGKPSGEAPLQDMEPVNPYSEDELQEAYDEARDSAINDLWNGRFDSQRIEPDNDWLEDEARNYIEQWRDYLPSEGEEILSNEQTRVAERLDFDSPDSLVQSLESGELDFEVVRSALLNENGTHSWRALATSLARLDRDEFIDAMNDTDTFEKYASHILDSELSDTAREMAASGSEDIFGERTWLRDFPDLEIHGNDDMGYTIVNNGRPVGSGRVYNDFDDARTRLLEAIAEEADDDELGVFDNMEPEIAGWYNATFRNDNSYIEKLKSGGVKADSEAAPRWKDYGGEVNPAGYEEVLLQVPNKLGGRMTAPEFTGDLITKAHFQNEGGKNTIAHARLSELPPEWTGKPYNTRFIKEMQSDWAQSLPRLTKEFKESLVDSDFSKEMTDIAVDNAAVRAVAPQLKSKETEAAKRALIEATDNDLAKVKQDIEIFDQPDSESLLTQLVNAYQPPEKIYGELYDKETALIIRKALLTGDDDLIAGNREKDLHAVLRKSLNDEYFSLARSYLPQEIIDLKNDGYWARMFQDLYEDGESRRLEALYESAAENGFDTAVLEAFSDAAFKKHYELQAAAPANNILNVIKNNESRISTFQKAQEKLRGIRRMGDVGVGQMPTQKNWERTTLRFLVADAARRGDGAIAWPASPEFVGYIEGYHVPEGGWAKDAKGRYLSGGEDRTPIIKRYTEDLKKIAEKDFKKYGAKVELVEYSDPSTGKKWPVWSMELTPELKDAGKKKGFSIFSLAPAATAAGGSAALKQFNEMHSEEQPDG